MVLSSGLDDWEPWAGLRESVITMMVVKGKAVVYSVSTGTTTARDDSDVV